MENQPTLRNSTTDPAMTSSFDTTRCTHCRGTIEFEIQSAGQEIACQHCGKTFTLPTKQEVIWKARLTIAAINDLERFNAMQAMFPVSLGWACGSAFVMAFVSAICINIGAFLSTETLLGFIIWPWIAVFVIPMQWWVFIVKSKRKRPALPFYAATALGVLFLWLFWAYILGYAGLWATFREQGEFGFYPSWRKCLFFFGGALGLAACRQLSRADQWIRNLIARYEQLPFKPDL
jgi:ribosomal protein S27E